MPDTISYDHKTRALGLRRILEFVLRRASHELAEPTVAGPLGLDYDQFVLPFRNWGVESNKTGIMIVDRNGHRYQCTITPILD